MSRKSLLLFVVAAAVVTALGVFALRRGGSADGEARAQFARFAAPPATVRVAAVEQGEFAIRAEYVGTLRARSLAELYARTSGPIVEMSVDLGDRVERGQVLARIDPVEAEERLVRERASLRMAEATVAQRAAALKVAETTNQRVTALYEQQLVSEQDFEAAGAALLSAQAQLEVAEAAVAVARANLSAAEVELEKTRIVAPFDGFVGQRFLDVGAFAAANRPVLSVVDLSTIKTTISLVEKDAARIAVGQAAVVTTEAFPGREFEGRLARIASVFDPETNTAEAEVEIANPERRLKPGMFANVYIAYRTEPTALLVPRSALLENERETAVYVAEAAGEEGLTARRIPVVRLGSSARDDDDRVAVEGPLAAGDRVITLGQETLRDGSPLQVAGAAAAGGTGEGDPGGPDPDDPDAGDPAPAQSP